MAQMAQCMGKLWSNASQQAEPEAVFEGGGKPTNI
jgi:hypothetical protein